MSRGATTSIRKRRAIATSVALGWAGLACTAPAQSETVAPTYKADPCCKLCPRASDPTVYVTRFLSEHRFMTQGKDDWLFRTESDFAATFPVEETLLAHLARLVKALNSRGTQVLLLVLPQRGLLEADNVLPRDRAQYDFNTALANYRTMLQRFRNIGFIVPDYGLLTERPDGTDYFFHRDNHWSPDGARRTAQLIAETIKALPLYPQLRKTAFTTREQGLMRRAGILSIVASQLCGGNYPAEVVRGYVTNRVASDPFGDEPLPQIALIGTSFSATSTYHFAGFLRQHLQVEVFDGAVSGGSFGGALTRYLPAETFQESPPKLIIWEFAYNQIAAVNDAQLRQLAPLVSNGCARNDVLLSNQVTIPSGADLTEALFNGGDHFVAAKSSESVIDIQFDNPAVTEILAEPWYLDGKHELLNLRINDYARTNGRFMLELNRGHEYAQQPLVDFRVQVVTPLKKPTSALVKLCRLDN